MTRRRAWRRWLARWIWVVAALGVSAQAAIQFDVFLGYDGVVREFNWFPVICEVANDGPPFQAIVEFGSGQFNAGQTRRVSVELPTNTRKRLVIPVFSPGRYASWNARLLDERGHVRAEISNLRCKRDAVTRTVLIGAVPRSFGGLPLLPASKLNRAEVHPAVCHLRPELFPDNPVALEGLDVLYVNTEKALELRASQAAAMVSWVHAGGHLMVAIEQASDLSGLPWLRAILPFEPGVPATLPASGSFQSWLTTFEAAQHQSRLKALANAPVPANRTPSTSRPRNSRPGAAPKAEMTSEPLTDPYAGLAMDPAFEASTILAATGNLRDGQVLLTAQNIPLLVEASRGRGRITVLTFSPEREPFRSWKNRAWFWARLVRLPEEVLLLSDQNVYGGWSIDGFMGAMIDSKQVRKLPVIWLLVLLVVYLAVIGPVDHYGLKKINKQMLTWITFPLYVIFFSLLIYFIGYRLRAGETEWNELHIVDILPRGEGAELRGRTYTSIYSPANARYNLASDLPHATLRSESQGPYGGGQEASRTVVDQRDHGFRAAVTVPVWTSQLLVHEWWKPAALPIALEVRRTDNGLEAAIRNLSNRTLSQIRLAAGDRIYSLGELKPQQSQTRKFERGTGEMLRDFVQRDSQGFQAAIQERRQAFGSEPSIRNWDMATAATAASFLRQFSPEIRSSGYARDTLFVATAGFDLSALLERGQAILFAWDAGHTWINPTEQFTPRRSQRDTLLRLAAPVTAEGNP